MNMLASVHRHFQQTSDCLQCIRQHPQIPEIFQAAVLELRNRCTILPAFLRAAQQSLMGRSTVVNCVSTQPGFNLELGCLPLGAYTTHKEKLILKSVAIRRTVSGQISSPGWEKPEEMTWKGWTPPEQSSGKHRQRQSGHS
ncbi:zinc finger MIZ domain-containing protein 1-like [Stegostoma tigrinum]|uniref:zinc finger MIZ domain-containing protein 1-like n=1 Tax=Stegostoma tigrinum TaxID=3053191 RepID=UPI0028705764|nr:zinc finger MIZ domain-containing protein 1-like [Stegostoma tigrinum]